MVLFLDLDESQAQARGGWGGEVYERAEMQRRVKDLFWALAMGARHDRHDLLLGDGAAPADEERGNSGSAMAWRQEEQDLVIVDAGLGVEEVAVDIWGRVEARIAQVEKGELGSKVRVVL